MNANVQVDHELATYNLTAPVVATFLHLFEPKAVMKNGKATGEPKFSLNLEFEADHVDLAPIKKRMLIIARARWPGRDFGLEAALVDKNGNKKMPTFIFPFSSGNDLADAAKAKQPPREREFSRGKAVLTSRTTKEPELALIKGGQIIDLTTPEMKAANKAAFYSGVEVLAELYIKAYDGVGTGADGVTAYLNTVVSINRGKKLMGGAKSAAETFKGYIGTVSQEDPTGGFSADLDDEIPF